MNSWIKETNKSGINYWFCSCGDVSWDGKHCQRGHPFGYKYTPKLRKRKYSGFSAYRTTTGEFQGRQP